MATRECPAWLNHSAASWLESRYLTPTANRRGSDRCGKADLPWWSFFGITVEFFAESTSRSCANLKLSSRRKARIWPSLAWAMRAMPSSSARKQASSSLFSSMTTAKPTKLWACAMLPCFILCAKTTCKRANGPRPQDTNNIGWEKILCSSAGALCLLPGTKIFSST